MVVAAGDGDAFATGGLTAWILRSKRASALTSTIWAWPLFLVALASLAFSRYLRFLPDTNPGTAAVELFECVFFGWLLLCLVEAPKSLASRALTFRPLILVGKVSYGIFVFHTLVAVSLSPWLKAAGLNETSYPFLRAAILAAISIAVAAASWNWMEQPLNRWVRNQEFDFSRSWERGKTAMSSSLRGSLAPRIRSSSILLLCLRRAKASQFKELPARADYLESSKRINANALEEKFIPSLAVHYTNWAGGLITKMVLEDRRW